MERLALTQAALHGEVWRLWSGHLVHFSALHFLLDAAAAFPPLLLLRRSDVARVMLWALVSAPMISMLILLTTPGVEYRGMSALVVGLWTLAPLLSSHRLRYVFWALIAAKLMISGTLIDVPPLPLAHWCGAISGLVYGSRSALRFSDGGFFEREEANWRGLHGRGTGGDEGARTGAEEQRA